MSNIGAWLPSRTLRVAKAAFNQTDNTGAVQSWDVVDSVYSSRGLLTSSGEPQRLNKRDLASTPLLSNAILSNFSYDKLGRPLTKMAARLSRQGPNGTYTASYGQALTYRTEYIHTGFKTSIKVCALAAGFTSCSGTTNNQGLVLGMTREFDESGAVINTTDAKNGVTTFFYDAAHSPVQLVDAENGITTANYNDVGHRTKVNDPNRGIWNYQYNGFGELKKQWRYRILLLTTPCPPAVNMAL